MANARIKRVFDNVLKVLSYFILVILVSIALFLVIFIVANQYAKMRGERPLVSLYTIVSPSMEPTIKVYDVIIDFKVDNEAQLQKGDIITFYSDYIDTGGFSITHRIYDIFEQDGQRYYLTKGDNNQKVDNGTITFKNIIGEVRFVIPKLGKLQMFISSRWGWLLIIFIPAMGIIIYDISKILKLIKIKKEIDDLPKVKEVSQLAEKEENKKIRAVIEKANKINKDTKK